MFDENDNECPDAIKFFEEVCKEKEINFDEIQLVNFKIHEFREEIEYELDSESKYFAFDWVCFENIPDLEIYKLCEIISVEVHIIEPKEHSKDSNK